MRARPSAPRDLIIVPVYNEARSIPHVMRELEAAVPRIDIIAVDDGSTDDSLNLLEQAAARWQARFHIVSHPANTGYGAALMRGFQFALEEGYDRCVTIDC